MPIQSYSKRLAELTPGNSGKIKTQIIEQKSGCLKLPGANSNHRRAQKTDYKLVALHVTCERGLNALKTRSVALN